jgi:hypothetical protein
MNLFIVVHRVGYVTEKADLVSCDLGVISESSNISAVPSHTQSAVVQQLSTPVVVGYQYTNLCFIKTIRFTIENCWNSKLRAVYAVPNNYVFIPITDRGCMADDRRSSEHLEQFDVYVAYSSYPVFRLIDNDHDGESRPGLVNYKHLSNHAMRHRSLVVIVILPLCLFLYLILRRRRSNPCWNYWQSSHRH